MIQTARNLASWLDASLATPVGARHHPHMRRSLYLALAFVLVVPLSVATAQPRERIGFLLSGHSLTDEPIGAMIAEIATSLGHDTSWQRQNVVGSPISARTVGHRNDPRDPGAFPWVGYSNGRGRD